MVEIIGDAVCDYQQNDILTQDYYFASGIYYIEKPEFLDSARKVAKESIDKVKKNKELDKLYPVIMSENFVDDERVSDLVNYIKATAWNILGMQGYDISYYEPVMNEFWCQEHHQHSGMDQHLHGMGSQISGFYILECPENGPRVIFHDPRQAKVYANLLEYNINGATPASNMINYNLKPGMMMFTNSWLPHQFTKNPSKKPFKFIHFNISVNFVGPKCGIQTPEII